MWEKPVIQKLSDDRLQLRHGPIRVVLKAWGDPETVRKAQRLVTRHFPKILPELAGELAELRKPLTKAAKFQGKVAQRMADAAWPFADVYVTPMAAVAGSVAEEVLRILQAAGPIERAFVNDGGDIAFHLEPGEALKFGVAGDFSVTPFAGAFYRFAVTGFSIGAASLRASPMTTNGSGSRNSCFTGSSAKFNWSMRRYASICAAG